MKCLKHSRCSAKILNTKCSNVQNPKTSQRHIQNAWTQSAIVFYLVSVWPHPFSMCYTSQFIAPSAPWVVFLKWVLTPSIPRKFSSCLRSLISFAQMLEYLSCEFKFIAKLFLSMKLLWKAFLRVVFPSLNWFHFHPDITMFEF